MKARCFLLVLLAAAGFSIYAQTQQRGVWGDGDVARRYVDWAQKALDEGRTPEALTTLERAYDFANVSSDVSYLLAYTRSLMEKSRIDIIEALDMAIDTNRWVSYNENTARLLKAEQLVAMRDYAGALACLEQTVESADSAMLQLLAFRGMAAGGVSGYDPVQALARFRRLVLSAMDRYPRDPRPLRIFFEYARNRNPQPSSLAEGDVNLMELAMRRLPFLLETDPNLAWMAAPFMRDTQTARRYTASFRTGTMSAEQGEGFEPHPGSIPVALNLGLISDIDAIEELFKKAVLEKNIVVEIYDLIRSEEARNLFTQKLLSFSGSILSDDDRDGIIESFTLYNLGLVTGFFCQSRQSGENNLQIHFGADGVPDYAEYYEVLALELSGMVSGAERNLPYLKIQWERYPSVGSAVFGKETFQFRPANFQFAPVSFIELGGSRNLSGLSFPVLSSQFAELSRRSLISFCFSLSRPSVEIDDAVETILMERGVLLQATEALNGKQVSITEFERGLPTVQRIDLDLDGRMETVRRFRRPDRDYLWADFLDYRRLIASSESDWSGDGRHKTMEVYRRDGSVVYSWDMDGSGSVNYEQEGGN